ncbi:MAG: isocitrate lyase/phosphoenolpyruvate mutase family protein [Pseudomonadota bacterium]
MTDRSAHIARAEAFAALHNSQNPLVLVNVWDAGSAQAVARAGAKALATGSDSLAKAQGFDDGEEIALSYLLHVVERILATTDCPLSVDLESGFARQPDRVAQNVRPFVEAGVVGLNLEDQVIGQGVMFSVSEQSARIEALRAMAKDMGVPLFINARTDLFLQQPDPSKHGVLIDDAIERAAAYREAGASGFFVPALTDPHLVERLVSAISLPLNVMVMTPHVDTQAWARLGVSRISQGPAPYRRMMGDLEAYAQGIFADSA